MSERGSFVTEYIYCSMCFDTADQVLTSAKLGPVARLCASIIAGKIGGSYGGGELHTFEWNIVPALEATICHPLRVAVLGEEGEQIFTIHPKGEKA